ncbi:MAG: ATP-binding protein [Desulfuromonadaceae bacterium]|nr:ATP-binding protein [Desulfuromonadaceae bacterium]
MQSISRQILTTLLLTIVIVLGGWSAVEILTVQHTEAVKLAGEAQLASERLAHNLVYPLWNMNQVEVEKDILFETRATIITAVIVLDEAGNIYAGKIATPDGSVESWNRNNPSHRNVVESGAKKISTNIVHNGKTIGTVVLYTNGQYLKGLLRTQITLIIIKLMVLAGILFGVTYTSLRRLVAKPLTILKDWAATATADNRTVAPEMRQSVEIAALTSAINRMNHDLLQSYNHLHEQAALLGTEMAEKQIVNEELQEKTAELEEEIEERRAVQQSLEEQAGILEKEISERVRIQGEHDLLGEQLRQSQKMEAIGLLAGGVAHDFNNILSVIMGYGGLIMAQLSPGSKAYDNATQILKASERAAELTKGLLAFSRKQNFNLELTDINQLATESSTFLKRVIGEDIELITSYNPSPLYMLLDRSQIQQVLMNLATNARDAMPTGGTMSIDIASTVLDDGFVNHYGYGSPGDYALIRVSDSGEGMGKETALRIFEPFFTTKEKGKGTGLGLSIIHGIVAQHKGFIQCDSEPGEGTSFSIYLPLCKEAECMVAPMAESEEISPRGTETILLAEDDGMLMEITANHLESSGYKVLKAFNGAEAVEMFNNHLEEIDLVMLDAIMPRMTGKQAWDEIQELRPGIKACFISGYTHDIIGGKIAVDFSLPFISKPVMPATLLKRVREILDGVSP